MAIGVKFSNGFERVYKGTRPVTAAWMITRKSDGEVLVSGFSLDRGKAQKTAESKGNELHRTLGVDLPSFYLPRTAAQGSASPAFCKNLVKKVRAAGLADDIEKGKLTYFKAFELAKKANADANEAARAAMNIEVQSFI